MVTKLYFVQSQDTEWENKLYEKRFTQIHVPNMKIVEQQHVAKFLQNYRKTKEVTTCIFTPTSYQTIFFRTFIMQSFHSRTSY